MRGMNRWILIGLACLVPVFGLGLALGYWTLTQAVMWLSYGALGMAVTANQISKRRDADMGNGPAAGTTHFYVGTFVFWNTSGYLDDDTDSGANRFAGVVLDEVDNSTGSDGDLDVEFYREGVFYLPITGAAITDVGKEVFASDNYTITLTDSASAVPIGVVAEYVSATLIGVRIYGAPHQVSLEGNVVAFTGATGANEIRIPDNLADGLSVEGTHGDFMVFVTTNAAEKIRIVEATDFEDDVTLKGAIDLIFSGTTGQSEVVVQTNLADALSVKDSAGDLIVVCTTTGAQSITITPLLSGAKIQTTATAVTATADGLTTGAIPAGASFVAVTSDNADKIVTLPAPVVGHVVRIQVGATGCELRTVASSNVKINDVDADGTNELALAADQHYICECISATEWIVRGFTALGADAAALVPDAA